MRSLYLLPAAALLFIQSIFSQELPGNYKLSFAGKFFQESVYNRTSDNGQYSCTFRVKSAGDEVRELTDFIFYKNDLVQYKLDKVPGSDLYISNSGIAAFIDQSLHFNQQITINFYSPACSNLFSESFKGAFVFGFSPDGNYMGVGTTDNFNLLSLKEAARYNYPKCLNFDISENGKYILLAGENDVKLFSGNNLVSTKNVNAGIIRKIRFIDESSYAYISRDNFSVVAVSGNEIYSSGIPSGNTYNDLLAAEGRVFAGISKRQNNNLQGYYSEFSGNKLTGLVKAAEKDYYKPVTMAKVTADSIYDPIPWPFYPYDSTRTIWNHYEQNMGYGDNTYSYLHQGLDLIVPNFEPSYAVQQGVVKCVLTIGGAIYWRAAISPVQSSGRSDGWLYAHLVESTIAINVGDTVDLHDYIADMIPWAEDWAHIHFVQISDSGSVWLYSDNEWGINFNPLLALVNLVDTIPPVIENAAPSSKFEFCRNETSIYLDPDSLYDKVDILVKVVDYIGRPEWQQPAYKSYYYIKRLSDNEIVLPRTLGHILNHKYKMYSGANFEPYAKVLYKLDLQHPASSWMDTVRSYYHIITNNNGDEFLELSEKNLALNTALFGNGWYRIFVEVYDPSGNHDIDSMDVKFVNPFVSADDIEVPLKYELLQNYPNPFNPSTTIRYSIPEAGVVKLILYDILGNELAILSNEYKAAGTYSIEFNADKLPSGVYIYSLKSGDFISSKKLIVLK